MDKIISLWEKQQQHDFKKQKEEKPHFHLRTYFKNIAKHSGINTELRHLKGPKKGPKLLSEIIDMRQLKKGPKILSEIIDMRQLKKGPNILSEIIDVRQLKKGPKILSEIIEMRQLKKAPTLALSHPPDKSSCWWQSWSQKAPTLALSHPPENAYFGYSWSIPIWGRGLGGNTPLSEATQGNTSIRKKCLLSGIARTTSTSTAVCEKVV